MRIAIVSDIHGNLGALLAVIDDLKDVAPDLVVHGGDLAANGARPAEVVDLVRDLGWPGVAGNTDEMLWRPDLLPRLQERMPSRGGLREVLFKHIAPFTADCLGVERLEWLEQLPNTWSASDLTVLHASPDNLWRAPLAGASDSELRSAYSGLRTSRVVYGHIHRPFVRTLDRLTVANAGSVSLSYDGDPRAAYAVVDDGGVSIRRVDYDRQAEARWLRQRSCPYADWLERIMLTGTYSAPVPGAVDGGTSPFKRM